MIVMEEVVFGWHEINRNINDNANHRNVFMNGIINHSINFIASILSGGAGDNL
jgi:hypothetical protein